MSFLAPLFLAAATVALVPVLLHLVRRMKAKEVPFSSLMFLQASPMERIRRRKLRDLLLLMLRMAMIVLLATAFARPYLMQEGLPFVPEREDESVVILVDQSLSMQASSTFREARAGLREIIDGASGNDEFALVAFSDEARQLSPLTRDLQRLEAAAATLHTTHRTTDYVPALQLAEDILQEARHATQRIVLISDMQQGGFSPSVEEYTVPEPILFEPIAVGVLTPGNRYVNDFSLTIRRREDAAVVRLDARHMALAPGDSISLILDGRVSDRNQALVEGSGRTSFQYVADAAGLYEGHLALQSDALPADNRHYFTYVLQSQPSLLMVAGDRDAYFLQRAFDLGEQSRFDVTRNTRLSGSALLRHDVAFLANVPALTSRDTEMLLSFLGWGGHVVISFGDAYTSGGFDAGLQQFGIGDPQTVVRTSAEGLQPAFIGQTEPHPIFVPLAGSSALLRPKFRQYVRIAPAEDANVIARYDNGDPFLMERRIGKGTLVVYTSSMGTSWSDLALNDLFIPLVYQIATHATTLNEPPRQFTVGDPVPLRGTPDASWDINTPDGAVYKVSMDTTGTGYFRDTDLPGHYTAVLDEERYDFSVNTDPRESVLAARSIEEVYAAVAGTRSTAATTPEAATINSEDAENDMKLWRIAILAVLGLFAVETLLSYRNRTPHQA